jgi:hypothetical protein
MDTKTETDYQPQDCLALNCLFHQFKWEARVSQKLLLGEL